MKDQILFIVYDLIIMGKDFMRFKFKTNDDLPYNTKINVSVCVMPLSSALEQGWYYPQIELQDCFYENCDYDDCFVEK